MKPRILLVNPSIYDFAAYDFWLKPYGLLSVAGRLRGRADFVLFDYLDRLAPFVTGKKTLESDKWGRGQFFLEKVYSPQCLSIIPRHFRRFGLPRSLFKELLSNEKPFDFVFIQTMMTYWYPGVQEAIEDIRKIQPQAKIVLGGNYVTLCGSHAQSLEADLLIKGLNLEPLWQYLGIAPDLSQPALWEIYEKLKVGVLKLSDGCPFSCTYCSVPQVYGRFRPRPFERAMAEYELLSRLGVENIAFYDDALLYEPQNVLIPFLDRVIQAGSKINLHSPNALNPHFSQAH